MDIKAMMSSTVSAAAPAAQNAKPQQNTTAQMQTVTEESKKSIEKKSASKLPYVAGTIILAGIGVYLGRNHISKLFKEKEIIQNQLKSNLKHPPYKPEFMHLNNAENVPVYKMPENIVLKKPMPEGIHIEMPKKQGEGIIKQSQKFDKHAEDIQDVVPIVEEKIQKETVPVIEKTLETTVQKPVETSQLKEIFVGFDEQGKAVYEEIPLYNLEQLAPVKSAYVEFRNSLNLGDKKILEKIAANRQSQAGEIERIIGENFRNGHVDLPVMNKVAIDFAKDIANRGENRYHQAADILEQSYIREFIKGDAKQKEGLQNFFDKTKADSPLFEIYTRMSADEAAARLRHLTDNEFKSASYKGMDAETFFEQSLNRLAEKLQFKKHDAAHNIKAEF